MLIPYKKTVTLALLLLLNHGVFAANAPPKKFSISTGIMAFSDFTSANGTSVIDASYSVPLSFSVKHADFRWGLSSAYLTQVDSTNTTVSGMGDTSLSVTYDLNDTVSIKGKHKFATGDDTLGFSTGEDDNSLSVDVYRMPSYKVSLFATADYKWVGKGQRTDRQNAATLSVGSSYRVSETFNLASSLDYSQSSYTTTDGVAALTVFGSHKTGASLYLGWFISKDSTDIYAIGSSLSHSF